MAETSAPEHGISEATLQALVARFYAKARADALLGPVFAGAIRDWEPHLAAITDFWCASLLGSRRYRGDAFGAHARHALTPPMLDRWLALWSETVGEMFQAEDAAELVARAKRVAASLRAGLFDGPASRARPPGDAGD